jgi:hypothetical protein
MPAREIKELRQAGELDAAFSMAKAELEADPSNIWCKRNLSWVLYAQLDSLCKELNLFLTKITEVIALELPTTEEMFYEVRSQDRETLSSVEAAARYRV